MAWFLIFVSILAFMALALFEYTFLLVIPVIIMMLIVATILTTFIIDCLAPRRS